MTNWGSIQYEAASEDYDKYFEYRREGKSMDEALKELGFVFTHGRQKSFEELKSQMQSEILIGYVDGEDWEDLSSATTVEDIFRILRDEAWDLWSAAPAVLQVAFEDSNLEGTPVDHTEEANGLPWMNQMVIMGESSDTGLACAILVDLGIVKDASCFEDFST